MRSLSLLVIFLIDLPLFGQTLNMEFFGNWNGRSSPTVFGRAYSACWGYVAADGREYALLGTTLGTSIIELTDSLNLVERAFISGPSNGWREMKTYKHYAYIVSESSDTLSGAGVQIVDLSNLPTSAQLVKTFIWTHPTTGQRFPSVHTISVSGNYLYLNGGNFSGVRILDISDPVNPRQVGQYVGPYVHDSFIRNDTIFAAAINGEGLDIVDARVKSSPSLVKRIQYPGAGTHNAWTTTDRRYVLTTDEIGSTAPSLKIWNISDIQNPTFVTEVFRPTAIVHNVFVKGNLAYVAWYGDGLRVLDITDPTQPVEVAYYDTYPESVFSYVGAWGADPYFPSGKVIISDMQTGLYVVRYTGDKRGKVVGTIRDALTNQALSDVLLHFIEPVITRWTGSDGKYLFGYAPGTFKVKIERQGYFGREELITVRDGQTDTVNITLSPLVSVEEPTNRIPERFSLSQNYPNPFNPTTTISFTLPEERPIRLSVLNILGQELFVVAEGIRSAGTHQATLDAGRLTTGVYFYKLVAGSFVDVKKMVVLR
ncbi:MAG TPA: choice-of-anchor B family protein [Bacteroidota bacterium]|nr:choice-of-anchor B family protein [Bacteroidota bacterium]